MDNNIKLVLMKIENSLNTIKGAQKDIEQQLLILRTISFKRKRIINERQDPVFSVKLVGDDFTLEGE